MMYWNVLETDSDRDVFRRLYEENRQMLFAIVRRKVQCEADAEDAISMGLLGVAENFTGYRHLPYEDLVRLTCVAVRNASLDIRRQYEKKVSFFDGTRSCEDDVPDVAPDILEQLIVQSEQCLVTQALLDLTEEERDILNLQYVWDLKPKTIGKMLSMTAGSVRKKTYKCRNKLAKILEEKGYESL